MVDDGVGTSPTRPPHGGAVERAATSIRALITSRVLLPGVQVRQEDLAREIGLSRGPTREALRILAAQGALTYSSNRGYFVADLTADDMRQVYRIRDLLETDMLQNLGTAPPSVLGRLRQLNDGIRTAGRDIDLVISLNREFHSTLLSLSTLKVLRSQLAHLDGLTTAYQSLSVSVLEDWQVLTSDHEGIIAALESRDTERLVALSREHRERSLTRLTPLLRRCSAEVSTGAGLQQAGS